MSRLPLVRERTPERNAALAVVEHLLDAADGQLWRTFIALTEQGLRRQAHSTLDRLIESIAAAYPGERRVAWVKAICHARWDAGALERLPFPLLERLVLPELRRGLQAGLPDYARWLGRAMLSSDLGGGKAREELRQAGLSADELLREALALNPHDAKARAALIESFDAGFDSYIHELPSGVLADAHTFSRELDEFEELIATHGATEHYATRVRTWRFHSQAWGDYRRRRSQFASYADYLAQVHPDHQDALRALLPWLRQVGDWQRVNAATSQLLREASTNSPERWSWLCYRAQASLALGELATAEVDIDELARSPHSVWQRRARELKNTADLRAR